MPILDLRHAIFTLGYRRRGRAGGGFHSNEEIMSYLRELETRQAEIVGLKSLLLHMPDDPIAKPLLTSRLQGLETELAALEKHPPARPEAELLFAGRPAVGSVGLDAKFASKVLDSFQDMVANHYSALRHGAVGSRGPRTGDEEARLCLTALPRGSFGLLLTQPQAEDFIAAAQLSNAMDQITSLVEAAASGDAAFADAVEKFHPRVLTPFDRFLSALENQEASIQLRTTTRQCALSVEQVRAAKSRVADTKSETETIRAHGVCRGILLESWRFDFNPDGQPPISGILANSVTDEQAKAMLSLVDQPAEAELRTTRMRTRSGFGRPTYELLSLERLAAVIAPK
jgi:hypothetical protein